MRRYPVLMLLLLTPATSYGAEKIAPAALIAAAKSVLINQIDYARRDCRDTLNVEAWLRSVVGPSAKSIAWSGGACKLANKQNPIDAGTDWCAQAEIAPKQGGDMATVEIYFEKPKQGRPGEAFAFRGIVNTKDGWDYVRDTAAFAADWRATYAPDESNPASDDCR